MKTKKNGKHWLKIWISSKQTRILNEQDGLDGIFEWKNEKIERGHNDWNLKKFIHKLIAYVQYFVLHSPNIHGSKTKTKAKIHDHYYQNSLDADISTHSIERIPNIRFYFNEVKSIIVQPSWFSVCAVALFAISVSRSLFLFHVCFRAKALHWHGYVRYSIANVVDVFRLSIHFITMLAVAVYCLVFFSFCFFFSVLFYRWLLFLVDFLTSHTSM